VKKSKRGVRSVMGRFIQVVLIVTLVLALGSVGSPYQVRDSEARSVVEVPVVRVVGLAEEDVVVIPNPTWKVNVKERVTACDNRPGLKKIYVTVLDEKGDPLRGVKVRFETEPSEGMAYDHMNIWGLTNENGYLEWNHLGIPTRYMMFMGEDEVPLAANIRTDLGNEYCRPPGAASWAGNVPVNRSGIYSYRFEVQLKGQESAY
jgi:hypothetical protein